MKNILLIGKTGNLGFEINRYLKDKNYRIFSAVRNPIDQNDFLLTPNKSISLLENIKIDLIINAANRYYVNPNPVEVLQMHESIVGIAKSIYKSNYSCPIIYFSSYLQYLPSQMQPWSDYTNIKSTATEILNLYAKEKQTLALELVLYDNYGGIRKNKFFDLAIEAAVKQKSFSATEGDTVVNLTHITDIVKALEATVRGSLFRETGNNNLSYSIYSSDTLSLKNVVGIIEDVLKVKVPVMWGAIPYRQKEVFEFHITKPILPYFIQENFLANYILYQAKNIFA